MKTIITLAAAMLLAAPLPASAQDKPAAKGAAAKGPEAPKPAAELAALKVFVGNWKCKGETMDSPMGAAHPFDEVNAIKADLDGFWFTFTHEEKKSKVSPGFKAVGHWGYDSANKKYVRAAMGTWGVWETASSKGWEGDKLVWDGDSMNFMGAPKTHFHHTFTKKSEKEIEQVFETENAGKWSTLTKSTCKK